MAESEGESVDGDFEVPEEEEDEEVLIRYYFFRGFEYTFVCFDSRTMASKGA